MKKLLGILGTIAVAGSTIPTVIAMSPHSTQEQDTKLINSEINYLQTNNLKKINEINNTNYIINDSKNNIYFATDNGAYILKNDNGNDTVVKIAGIENNVKSLTIDSKDNIYFATDNGAYILKNNEIKAEFVKGINNSSSFSENYSEYLKQLTNITGDINNILINKMDNDAIFITTNTGVYATLKPYSFEGKTSLSLSTGIKRGQSFSSYFLATDKNNNVYFSTLNEVYFLNIPEAKYQEINGINGNINYMINNQDNLYIATNNGLYILKSGETTATKINDINHIVNLINVDNNNNIYIGTNNGLYILKNEETKLQKINNIDEKINNILIDKNNNIYFNANNIIYLLSFSDNNNNNVLIKKINYINSDISIKNIFIINDNIYIATYDGTYILCLKNDLKNIDNLYLKDLILDESKTYKNLTEIILSSEIFKKFKLVNPNIKFLDMNGNDISNKQQNLGQFQVKIIANENDFYWNGETKLIVLNFIDEIAFLIQENQHLKETSNKIKLDLELMYKQIEQKKNLYNEMQIKIFQNYEKIIELQNKQIINLKEQLINKTNKDNLLLEIKEKIAKL